MRELVAVLVDEFGPEVAARMLEYAAGQARRAGFKHTHATAPETDRLPTVEKEHKSSI